MDIHNSQIIQCTHLKAIYIYMPVYTYAYINFMYTCISILFSCLYMCVGGCVSRLVGTKTWHRYIDKEMKALTKIHMNR